MVSDRALTQFEGTTTAMDVVTIGIRRSLDDEDKKEVVIDSNQRKVGYYARSGDVPSTCDSRVI